MIKLYKHQEEGIKFIVENKGNGALFYDCGLGKTLIALEIFKELKKSDTNLKLLVICPLVLIRNAWEEDIHKFTQYTFQDLHALTPRADINNVDIYLMNYEMTLSQIKIEKIFTYLKDFPILCVLDESSRIKTHNSHTTKTLLKLKNFFKYRVIMSGTPAPNEETEYWGQIRFLSDTIFSKSFYTFRNNFFHLCRGNQIMNVPNGTIMNKATARAIFSKGFKYAISDKNRAHLLLQMKNIAIYRKLEDCIDLPEQTHIIREVTLSKDQSDQYKSMKNELVAEIQGNYVSAPFALTKISKLRQITSGFIIDSESEPINFQKNSKLEALLELLAELKDKQAIIWGWFTHEIDFIHSKLKERSVIVNGTVTEEEKNDAIQRFKSGEVQYLIANPQSVAHGLTLTNCHYSIYYSLSYSWEQLSQSISRIHRLGQKNVCMYYYLLCNNTIDNIIYETLQRKGSQEEIVRRLLK